MRPLVLFRAPSPAPAAPVRPAGQAQPPDASSSGPSAVVVVGVVLAGLLAWEGGKWALHRAAGR